MPERTTDRRRRREGDPTPSSPSPADSRADPVLALQRSSGNAAVAQLLARAPAGKGATGTAHISGVGEIKVSGGNLEEWAGKETPDTVDAASETGRHSAKLEKLSTGRTKTDVKLMISPAHKEGEHLNVGGGTQLEVKGARIKGYAVEGGMETWSLADFEAVKRTEITHSIGAG